MLNSDDLSPFENLMLEWELARVEGRELFRDQEAILFEELKVMVIQPVVKSTSRSMVEAYAHGGITGFGAHRGGINSMTMDAVVGIFVLHCIEQYWISKWEKTRCKEDAKGLDAYLRQCLRNDIRAPGENVQIQRFRTAQSRTREYLGSAAFQTVAVTGNPHQPWKAPVDWPKPIGLFDGDLHYLAARLTDYISSFGEVRGEDCRRLVDDIYKETHNAHYRAQVLAVMNHHGVFTHSGVPLESVVKPPIVEPSDPDEQPNIRLFAKKVWDSLTEKNRVILHTMLECFLDTSPGVPTTKDAVYNLISPRFGVTPSAIRQRCDREIWKTIHYLALRYGIGPGTGETGLLKILLEEFRTERGNHVS